jgi:hypothetical protein
MKIGLKVTSKYALSHRLLITLECYLLVAVLREESSLLSLSKLLSALFPELESSQRRLPLVLSLESES